MSELVIEWKLKNPVDPAWDPVRSLMELEGADVEPLVIVDWNEGG